MRPAVSVLLSFFLFFNNSAFSTIYTFIGSGNWSLSANWDGNGIPPNPLPAGDTIQIDCTGPSILDVNQTINSSASQVSLLDVKLGKTLTIASSKTFINYGHLLINGSLVNNGIMRIHDSTANFGDIRNNYMLMVETEGSINHDGSIYNNGNMSVHGLLVTNGNFTNAANLFLSGQIRFGGISSNLGLINNNGQFYIDGPFSNIKSNNNTSFWTYWGGYLNISDSFYNEGILKTTNETRIDLYGIVQNNISGVVEVSTSSTFEIFPTGKVRNYNKVQNLVTGTFINGGLLENYDSVINEGIFNNVANFINNGVVQNNADPFMNSGVLDNNMGANLILNTPSAVFPAPVFNWKSGSTLTIGPLGVLTVTSPFTVPTGAFLVIRPGGILNIQ